MKHSNIKYYNIEYNDIKNNFIEYKKTLFLFNTLKVYLIKKKLNRKK